MSVLREFIDALVVDELDEVNSIGAGNVTATSTGSALGGNMSPAHKKMWSGDKPLKKRRVQEKTIVRGHNSFDDIDKIRDVPKQSSNQKPSGFWYDCDGSWLRWVDSEMPSFREDKNYVVDVDLSQMLVIRDFESLVKFNDTYGTADILGQPRAVIDWARVAQEYAGIEICPFLPEAKRKISWYTSWDVASGCIWRASAVKKIELVKENLADKMGLKKATSQVRRDVIGGSPVYMDKHDGDKSGTKRVMDKVAKNLNRKPYSKKPPMMGLAEGVEWLIEAGKLLAEAKIDVAIETEKDPEIKKFLELVKGENLPPKFIPWLIKQARLDQPNWHGMGPDRQDVATFAIYLRKFDLLAQKNRIVDKDINSYGTLNLLHAAVQAAEQSQSKTAQKKIEKSETEVFYQDANYLILEPLSMAAACHYGQGTKWCISATQSQNYFDSYQKQGARFLFIINKQTSAKDAIAHTENGVEIYDAQDEKQPEAYITQTYPENIVEVLNQIWEKEYGVQPFIKYDLSAIMADPDRLIYDARLRQQFWEEPMSAQIRFLQALMTHVAAGTVSYEGPAFSGIFKKIIEDAITVAPGLYAPVIWEALQTDPQRRYFGVRFSTLAEVYTYIASKEQRLHADIVFPLVLQGGIIKNMVASVKENPGNDPTTTLVTVIAQYYLSQFDGVDSRIYTSAANFWRFAASPNGTNSVYTRANIVKALTWAEEINWNFFPQ